MKERRFPRAWWPIKRPIGLLLIAAMAMLGTGVCCALLRISHPRDVEAFLGMAAECHPVWKQFALRRFGAGDSAQELFRRFPPTRGEEFGHYGVYSYTANSNGFSFTGLSVVSRDGRLVSAASGSCTWHFTFFMTEDPELERQYAAMVQVRHRKAEQSRLEGLQRDLERFHTRHDRWPTNEAEFGWFVTGKPPGASADKDEAFRARYGLTKATRSSLSSISTNPLGIALLYREDGALTISLTNEPGFQRTVARPSK
jgi:hypothetical protein